MEYDDDESVSELEAELVDFTRSTTWRKVMVPSLRRRQHDIARRLCTNTRMTLEEVREQQTIHAFIAAMLEEPIKFFFRRDEP